MESNSELMTGPAPHWHEGAAIIDAMQDVLLALIPITLTGIFIFGAGAVLVIITCVTGAVLGEIAARRYKGEQTNLGDGTAVVTGLLLALTLPPTAWWAVVPLYTLGGFLSVAIFREAMGGLGRNRFNPALMGRVFLLFGRTALVYMAPFLIDFNPAFTPWLEELEVIDVMAKATPLLRAVEGMELPSYSTLLTIYEGGSPAETSVLAVIIGIFYLIYRGRISWRIPAAAVIGVFLFSLTLGQDPLFQVLSGGLLFGAGFMATDWVTRPVTDTGKIIYGLGIAVLVVFFRQFIAELWVGYGGVAFSILLMNGFVRYIDKLTARRVYGKKE